MWCQDSASTSRMPRTNKLTDSEPRKEPHSCVKGAKQFMAWHQLEGNNIIFEGFAKEKGEIWRSPGA